MRTLKQHRKEAAEIKRVGGQALFNGVLMRGGGRTASAVRSMSDPNTVASTLKKLDKAAEKTMTRFLDSLEIDG